MSMQFAVGQGRALLGIVLICFNGINVSFPQECPKPTWLDLATVNASTQLVQVPNNPVNPYFICVGVMEGVAMAGIILSGDNYCLVDSPHYFGTYHSTNVNVKVLSKDFPPYLTLEYFTINVGDVVPACALAADGGNISLVSTFNGQLYVAMKDSLYGSCVGSFDPQDGYDDFDRTTIWGGAVDVLTLRFANVSYDVSTVAETTSTTIRASSSISTTTVATSLAANQLEVSSAKPQFQALARIGVGKTFHCVPVTSTTTMSNSTVTLAQFSTEGGKTACGSLCFRATGCGTFAIELLKGANGYDLHPFGIIRSRSTHSCKLFGYNATYPLRNISDGTADDVKAWLCELLL